jgi:hypothetical protein|tara:strand:+ start:802 stop:987 length:186 start_codon:yes stop_codon:yes gene_type:complete
MVIYGLHPENYSASPLDIVFNGGCVRLDLLNRLCGHRSFDQLASVISWISCVSLVPVFLAL